MRVVKQRRGGEIYVELLDDDGTAIPTVSPFLRHLLARGCSPNTLLAYAHYLQRLFRFLHSAGLALGDFTPARALDFLVDLRDLPCRDRRGLRDTSSRPQSTAASPPRPHSTSI